MRKIDPNHPDYLIIRLGDMSHRCGVDWKSSRPGFYLYDGKIYKIIELTQPLPTPVPYSLTFALHSGDMLKGIFTKKGL